MTRTRRRPELLAAVLLLAAAAGAPTVAQNASENANAGANADLTLPAASSADLVAAGFLAPEDPDASCPGRVAVVRFNRAREGATLAQFTGAVAAHDAWMLGKGYADVELVALTAAPLSGASGRLLFGSMQIYPSQARFDEITAARSADRDADYEAFVALYTAATEGSTGFRACLRDVAGG
jgi:hypothetical protein